MSPNRDALSELLDGLTQPLNFMMGVAVLAVGVLSLHALILGFVVMIVILFTGRRGLSYRWLMSIAGAGFVLSLLPFEVSGVSLGVIHQLNMKVLSELWEGHYSLFSQPVLWGIGLPYGLLLGSVLTLLTRWRFGLSHEVKRVGQGKLETKIQPLSPRTLDRRLKQLTQEPSFEGSVLGINPQNGQAVTLTDKDANCHTLVIGTTGAGKTTGLCNLIESAIVRQLPLIIVDGKGDIGLSQKVEAFAKAHGRVFYDFSMLGESVKYNPLASGGVTSKKDRIIALRSWTEDHYRKIAEGYLQTVFTVLDVCGKRVDLKQLAKFLEPAVLAQLLMSSGGHSHLLPAVSALKERRRDIESLVAEIENLANSEIGHLFDCQEGKVLVLEQVLNESAIVYFCLQPLAFPEYAQNLGKLIINDIKQLAATQLLKDNKPKLFVLLDEFSVFAGEQVIHLINQGRSAGIHAILSTQSLSDIETAGGEALVGQILNNCNNYIIQRQNNPKDAEVLTSIIGTYDGFEVTSQVQTGMSSSNVGTVRSVKNFIIHPDEIKRLGLGEAIFVNKQEFKVMRLKLRQSEIMRA